MIRKQLTYQRSHTKALLSMIPLLLMGIAIVVGVMNINTITLYFAGASGENANILVDASAVLGTTPRPWRNLAQGGENHDWRLTPISGQVKALNPEYIRIDHIFDFYDIVSRDGGGLAFNWAKIDPLVSDILSTGAKPYLSLSYMPVAIAVDGDITGKPTSWGEYQQVIQRTVQHFSKERGIENVAYEIWNEPNLFGGWKMQGEKNYLDLYGAAARGAQQAAQNGAKPFLIGGPATTQLYENWVDTLLPYIAENNLRMDFYSWHRYDREVDVYREDIQKIDNFLTTHPQFENVQFHITEWGHDPKNDAGYDGGYSAAHTVAVATELIGKIQRAFVFEIEDGKDPEGKERWGRWGLLTHNEFGSKAKARYSALRMLDRIGDQRLQMLGKGSWVKGAAAKSGDNITVILANYDPVSRHGETVPVTITNLDMPSYSLDLQYLDGTRRNDSLVVSEGTVKFEVPMLVNSVVFMTLTPQ